MSEISILLLVSVAEETGFEPGFVEHPEDRFCRITARL